jgi:PqqD family protein of HPr-rel-A system
MAGPLYIADPEGALRRAELDGLTACFHRPSGMTHILAPPAPQILAVLAENAGGIAEILARIGEHFEIEAEDKAAAIAARLAELEAAGLVRRA